MNVSVTSSPSVITAAMGIGPGRSPRRRAAIQASQACAAASSRPARARLTAGTPGATNTFDA